MNANEYGQWDKTGALALFDGDADLLGEIITMLLAQMRQQDASIPLCLAQQDWQELRNLTHAQLSSLKMLCFSATALLFDQFEAAVNTKDNITCARLAPEVAQAWQAVEATLAVSA